MKFYAMAIASMAIHPIAAIKGWSEVDTDITTAYTSSGRMDAYDYARSLHVSGLAIESGKI